MKRRVKLVKKAISLLLASTLVFTSLQVTPAKAEVKQNVSHFTGEKFEVNFEVTSKWEGAFNVNATVKNTSDKVIDNWAIGFGMPYEITNIWNAKIDSFEDGMYIIKNNGSNQDIAVGECVYFGFTGKLTDETLQLPDEFELYCEEVDATDHVEISLNIKDDWKSGSYGEIMIKNISDEVIEDWKLEFDYAPMIESFSTAVLLKQEGSHYLIKNAGYNANINPGETIKLEFTGKMGNIAATIENAVLTQILTKGTTITDIEKDTDGDGLEDYIEQMIGTDRRKKDTDGDQLSDFEEFILALTDPLLKDTDGDAVLDSEEDADEDGLTNLEEKTLGTVLNKPDSDVDGLKDGEEVHTYKTNPLDTDTDKDGLTDYEEVKLGLDPLNPISDGVTLDSERKFPQTLNKDRIDETLLDADQLVYPSISGEISGLIDRHVRIDLSDYHEYDSNRAVIGNLIDVIMPDGKAELVLSYDISKLTAAYGADYADELIICKLGDVFGFDPVDTTINGNTISATITSSGQYFVLNMNEFLQDIGIDVMSEMETELMAPLRLTASYSLAADLVALEEETKDYSEEVETDDNELVSSMMSNDSEIQTSVDEEIDFAPVRTFMLKSVAVEAKAPAKIKGSADIVFVLDATGSMGDEIRNVAKNINAFAQELVDTYNVNANFGLIEYQDITCDGLDSTINHKNGLSNWYSNAAVDKLKTNVNKIKAKGGGDTPETAIDGLEMARRLDWRPNATKFIILLTDAGYKVNNQYEIKDMAEEISLLQKDGIVTSVITSTGYQKAYKDLVNDTNGIYANIRGDFYLELLKLAEKIGEDTNKGEWVILDDYQAVRLNDPADDPDGDTDDDGVKDYDELGTKTTVNLNALIKAYLKRSGLPEEEYKGKTTIEVYNYISNPVMVDTDFDGISDGDSRDLVKRDTNRVDGNAFAGTLSSNGYTVNVEYKFDYRTFFETNTSYKKDLSVLGSILATTMYHGANLNVTSGTTLSGRTEEVMDVYGLSDVKNYRLDTNFSDDDISEVTVGHRSVTYKGETKEIIIAGVRGTNGTIKEWSSNFDVGADTSDYWDKDNSYWRNHEHHKGFDVAANRIDDYIQNYVNTYVDSKADKVIFIVGHSRGAAIANILGSLYENRSGYKTFVYTFATPMTTTSSNYASYRTIFNIVNDDDLVPKLPLNSWGFHKYGTTKSISVNSNYEDSSPFGDKPGTFEWFTGEDYDDDGGTGRTISCFDRLANDRDGVYKYTCSCHGDGSDNDNILITNTFYYFDKTKADTKKAELLASYTDRMKHYVDVDVYDTPALGVHRYTVESHQTAAFLMMVLADLPVNKKPFAYETAPRFKSAKASFIGSGCEIAHIGGITHPHMPITYYIIAHNNFQPLN
ncbi:MAG: cellulose binding domain-containing protein [Clostridiales bacterium]|nr:cellulose binding domain-containing protein [Clostridiales bacterium]